MLALADGKLELELNFEALKSKIWLERIPYLRSPLYLSILAFDDAASFCATFLEG